MEVAISTTESKQEIVFLEKSIQTEDSNLIVKQQSDTQVSPTPLLASPTTSLLSALVEILYTCLLILISGLSNLFFLIGGYIQTFDISGRIEKVIHMFPRVSLKEMSNSVVDYFRKTIR